jgi:hypothetical protein
LFSDNKGDPFIPMIEFPKRSLNQTLLNWGYFPAGMQGARHDHLSLSGFSNFLNDNSYGFFVNNLNIDSPTSNDLSPNNLSSLNTFGTDFVETHNNNTKGVGSGSIKLFGKIIQTVESDVHDSGSKGEDSSKGFNEI